MTNASNSDIGNQSHQANSDEIDLVQIFKVIWKGKWIVIISTLCFAVCSVFYAKSLPNIYKSEALVAPISEKKDGMGGLSQLGGLASLAGVNIGSGSSVDKSALAIETFKSREFLSNFIKKYEISKILFKNEEIEPSLQKACLKLQSMISIVPDIKTKMIRISIENESPEIAKEWLTKLIAELNDNMKQRDMEEAQKSIDYLKNQISQTNIADIKNILFQLIEEQTKTMMLVNVRSEYIFKTVDPAIAPEQKFKPSRAVICLSITLLGFAISLVILYFQQAFFKTNRS